MKTFYCDHVTAQQIRVLRQLSKVVGQRRKIRKTMSTSESEWCGVSSVFCNTSTYRKNISYYLSFTFADQFEMPIIQFDVNVANCQRRSSGLVDASIYPKRFDLLDIQVISAK